MFVSLLQQTLCHGSPLPVGRQRGRAGRGRPRGRAAAWSTERMPLSQIDTAFLTLRGEPSSRNDGHAEHGMRRNMPAPLDTVPQTVGLGREICLEGVENHTGPLANRRTMSRIIASFSKVSLVWSLRSYSLLKRRCRPSHPSVRSTIQHQGLTTNPCT